MFRIGTSKLFSSISGWRSNITKSFFSMANPKPNPVSASGPSVTQQHQNFSTDALKAQHEPDNSRFVIQLGNAKALLEYSETSPGVIDMYHTEVPVELQGKGIGKVLAKEAFDYVVKNDMKMKLSCSYLQKYIQDNPKEDYTKRRVE